MFNDLSSPTNQNRQAVDDIFAETDKTQETGAPAAAAMAPRPAGGSEIDTQRIGLAATDELSESAPTRRGQDNLFKIIIAIIAVAVLALGGYLVYSKFLSQPATTGTAAPTVQQTSASQTPTAATPAATGSFVETTGGASAGASTTAATPLIPGVNAPIATTTAETTASTSAQASLVDSDSDGLTDAEEKAAGTNINSVDTDNDGLSDYEEVKIYHTNPLSADTDGDGYSDGAEVKSGYNPNGPGKLSAAASVPATAPAIK